MKIFKLALLILLLIAAFSGGVWYRGNRSGKAEAQSNDSRLVHYICPMHPQYVSDRPGDCPSCGMRLVPSGKEAVESERQENPDSQSLPGLIHISAERQQLIGVRMATAIRSSGSGLLRTLGRIAPDETRLFVINATVDGWITSAGKASQGSFVKKNEVLSAFYSPEFLSATQALLYALSSADRVQSTGRESPAQKDQIAQFNISLRQYRDSLRNLGMGPLQIQRLIDSRQPMENVDITSPADGIILERKVSEGLRFNKGDEMYRISDLSRVWILLDVFENEEEYLRPGMLVEVTRPSTKTTFMAQVTNILPQFDSISRTLKVRLEVDNPGFRLRPDMFVDIKLPVKYPETLTVPSDAIIDSGLKTSVFVDRGNGFFEPRSVETGRRMGGLVEITRGLHEGERIVVAGNFLVDSESRLQMASMGVPDEHAFASRDPKSGLKNTATMQKDPVCGMNVDASMPAAIRANYRGDIYYFCSAKCRDSFLQSPARYLLTEKAEAIETAH